MAPHSATKLAVICEQNNTLDHYWFSVLKSKSYRYTFLFIVEVFIDIQFSYHVVENTNKIITVLGI